MKTIALSIVLMIAAWLLHNSSDYMHSKPTEVTVMDSYIETGGYKRSGSPVMVLRTDDGRYFDRYVTYSSIHRFGKGDRVVFNLRRMDIQQTGTENAVYFFGPVILFAIGLSGLLCKAMMAWLDSL